MLNVGYGVSSSLLIRRSSQNLEFQTFRNKVRIRPMVANESARQAGSNDTIPDLQLENLWLTIKKLIQSLEWWKMIIFTPVSVLYQVAWLYFGTSYTIRLDSRLLSIFGIMNVFGRLSTSIGIIQYWYDTGVPAPSYLTTQKLWNWLCICKLRHNNGFNNVIEFVRFEMTVNFKFYWRPWMF